MSTTETDPTAVALCSRCRRSDEPRVVARHEDLRPCVRCGRDTYGRRPPPSPAEPPTFLALCRDARELLGAITEQIQHADYRPEGVELVALRDLAVDCHTFARPDLEIGNALTRAEDKADT